MPRPRKPPASLGGQLLRAWLDEDPTHAAILRGHGVADRTIAAWCSGDRRPTLDDALWIHEVTDQVGGCRVPVWSWVRAPACA